MTEAELAQIVIAHLEEEGRDVYQEVKIHGHDRIADIVARQGRVLWVIEVKKSLSLDLLAQAHAWLWYAHLVSVVVPEPVRRRPGKWPRRPRHEKFVRKILDDYGIGLAYIETRHATPELKIVVTPKMRRPRLAHHLAEALVPEQKTFAAAGSPGGSVWSPYQQTCRDLAAYVAQHPGASLKDGVLAIEHHYANDKSAISSLRHWIERGRVKGIRMECDGRHLKLYPATEEIR